MGGRTLHFGVGQAREMGLSRPRVIVAVSPESCLLGAQNPGPPKLPHQLNSYFNDEHIFIMNTINIILKKHTKNWHQPGEKPGLQSTATTGRTSTRVGGPGAWGREAEALSLVTGAGWEEDTRPLASPPPRFVLL